AVTLLKQCHRTRKSEFYVVLHRKRSMSETSNYVLKRKYGEEIKARIYRNQVKEIMLKVVVYNLDRFIQVKIIVYSRFSTEPKNLMKLLWFIIFAMY
ncbi:MAG: hypothetical protein ACLFMM_09410, partial [Methanohalobium sp.]